MKDGWIDSHNHLQDPRLDTVREEVLECMHSPPGAQAVVVNGTRESDWQSVLDLAGRSPAMIPSFGLHPWHVKGRSEDWLQTLVRFLEAVPSGVGEVGLDRWVENHDIEDQMVVLKDQLGLALDLQRPLTLHCIRAWGFLEQTLRQLPRLPNGFLLHSYGGPAEMVPVFIKWGGFFSLSGYFAHPRKTRQAEVFVRHIPLERLLIETDAPDMWPPEDWNAFPSFNTPDGTPINHPRNIAKVYEFAAQLYRLPMERLREQVADNFNQLFGNLSGAVHSQG